MTLGFELLIIGLMLAVNAVFASYEMALASTSRARLAALRHDGKKGADQALYMKDRMEASLAVVQLGITFAGAVAAATGGAGVQEVFAPYLMSRLGLPDFLAEILSLICLIIPLSAFTIVFAELVPKMFALTHKESVCLALSPAMKTIALVANPVVSFFETSVKKIMALIFMKPSAGDSAAESMQGLHELTAAVALARASRLIGAHEEKIVLSAAGLSLRPIRDIMLPASDISMIPIRLNLSEALVKAHMDMHTRFPLCAQEGNPQTIEGYVNFKDILLALKMNASDPTLHGIMRSIMKIEARTPISQALTQMIQSRAHIALVSDSEQKVLGMITLEDILEELVGEIEDEFDRLPSHIQPYGSVWLMGGGVSMKNVFTTLGMPAQEAPPGQRGPTLSEWCLSSLGGTVLGGEVITSGGLNVVIRKLRRKKIAEAVVSKLPELS
ncbi:MAG: HlyC/CorC family transporter [Candidatus Omnitrophica bacterium]|nr:HlyC/CorC family transporter [Candidatus Omnitrophota bacterium]